MNFVTHAPVSSSLAKAAGGIAQSRTIPRFAHEPFTAWFRARREVNAGAPDVLLWPDTFNNYFHPRVAKAAVRVLEHEGFQVVIPERSLCCGRPLYDFGMLKLATKLLKQTLAQLSTAD